jgi:hypothetical protein
MVAPTTAQKGERGRAIKYEEQEGKRTGECDGMVGDRRFK